MSPDAVLLLVLLAGVLLTLISYYLFHRHQSQQVVDYQQLIAAIIDGIWVIDATGVTVYVNESMATMLGETITSLAGKSIYEVIHPDLVEHTRAALSRRAAGEKSIHETYLRLRNGRDLWIRVSTVPLYDKYHRFQGALAIISNITQERESRQALEDSEQRYRTIFENASDLVYVIDTIGNIVSLNSAITAMTGRPAAEYIGKNILELIELDEASKVQEVLSGFGDGVAPASLEVQVKTDSGNALTLEVKIQPLLHDGQLVGYTGIARDVSQRNLLALQELHKALEYERVDMLRRFIRNSSHDLRTPLSIINSSTYLVRRKLDSEELAKVARHIDNIEMQVLHLNEQLNNLYTLSEQQMHNLSQHFTDCHLDLITQAVLKEQSYLIERKQQSLDYSAEDDLPVFSGNEAEIHRGIRHLLINAINYTPDGGSISVTLSRDTHNLILMISDTGIGIEPEKLPFVFDPFYRIDEARSLNTGGMGLGLTITKAIVQAHNGEISIESTLNTGTTVIMKLPFKSFVIH